MRKSFALGILGLTTAVGIASAQGAGAPPGPPVKQVGPVVATSTEYFGPILALRHTPQGVLVNDGLNRRLLLLDSTLTESKIIADSAGTTTNTYSGRSAGLIAYRGDSSFFVDPASQSMLVMDGAGKVGRVMAIPGRNPNVLGSVIGAPAYDGQGRLVYRGPPNVQMRQMGGGPGGGPGVMQPPEIPDSTPVIRVHLETRATDTIGYTKSPRPKMDVQRDEATGRVTMNMIVNPLPTVDEFAVLSDGSIGIVRGSDYHVDWIRPDGTKESTAKMPFDWRRLSDEDKVTFLDSLKAARERILAAQPDNAVPAPSAQSTTTTTPGGGRQMVVMGGGPGPVAGTGVPGPMGMNNRNAQFVPAQELPDYQPPFFVATARADMDGRIWIQTIPTRAYTGGPVYDVINAKGELVERIQIPKDRQIVGFGTGGIVYMTVREAGKIKLERARLK